MNDASQIQQPLPSFTQGGVQSTQHDPVNQTNDEDITSLFTPKPQQQDDTQSSVPGQTEGVPETPVSVPSREGDPGMAQSFEKILMPSIPEMEIPTEMHKETGAEAHTEVAPLTQEDAQAGIVHAKESIPVSPAPTTTIALPMTQQQAQQQVKLRKQVKDSLYWLAMLIMRQWQVLGKGKK